MLRSCNTVSKQKLRSVMSKQLESTVSTSETVIEDVPFTVVQEGKARVIFPTTQGVFYNPVQEFNRDLSVAVLRLFSQKYSVEQKTNKNNISRQRKEPGVEAPNPVRSNSEGLRILEALSASGLRSIRYAMEVTGLKEVVANDYSYAAVESIRRNVQHNQLDHLITPSENDASLLMYQHRRDGFHAIDLDPYGCPSHFLDGAVQALKEGGLLMVTCTDMAVLAGNSPETCYVKYGAVSLKTKACHEMALRIVLQCVESHANRYGRYIVPLLSVSVDFYLRIFVRVYTSQAICKQTLSKLSMVYQCVGCETFTFWPLGRMEEGKGNVPKYLLNHGPPVSQNCQHCGNKHHIGGPIWMGPLHCTDFVSNLYDAVEGEWCMDFGTTNRLKGMLCMVGEELQDVPLYYTLQRLSSIVGTKTMSMLSFRSALLNAGYRVSLSHACRTSVKTDAPNTVIWDILREWEKLNPANKGRLSEGSVGNAIISKPISTTVSFVIHPNANPQSREKGLLRFQHNPERNWGPGSKAKTSLFRTTTYEKRLKNQGKRTLLHDSDSSKDDTQDSKVLKTEEGPTLMETEDTDNSIGQIQK